MKIGRLASMDLREMVGRGRQEASRWLDRLGSIVEARSAAEAPAVGCDPHRVRREWGARFFPGAMSDATPPLLKERFPAAPALAREQAAAILRGRFRLLGYDGLSFGDPIDWNLDPVSGRRAPQAHWTRIDPLDGRTVGDPKVIWELNRHQWMVTLGRAYRLDGDPRYALRFASLLRDWIRTNRPGIGINWTSGLEAAFRIVAWCWCLALFRDAPALTPALVAEVRRAIRGHAGRIERFLSLYASPNTHLTGEALGLFYAGTLFPDFPEAVRWRTTGRRILVERIESQVLPDGVYFEQSTAYQRYAIETYLHFLVLSERCGAPAPPAVAERVQRMLDFLLAIKRPDGTLPALGDADGGSLLPLAEREPQDARGLFSTAAALFHRADYAWAAGGLAPETLWLLGPDGDRAFRTIRPAPPEAPASRLFPDGGHAVMRGGWGPEDHLLLFDVGPLGFPPAPGHAHADLLGIECAAFGEPCVVDPGTYRYAVDPLWRQHFRGTASHSTVVVDGAMQAVPDGPFGWRSRPRSRLRRFLSTEAYDFADAEHDAYRRLPDPVTHRRRILFLKPGLFAILDDLLGSAPHRVEVVFQFAPLRAALRADGWLRAAGARGRGLFVRAFASAEVRTEIVTGGDGPARGWVSPDYGRLCAAPALVYETTARLPVRILTLLAPADGDAAAPPAIGPVSLTADGLPARFVLKDLPAMVVFEEDDVHLYAPGLAPAAPCVASQAS